MLSKDELLGYVGTNNRYQVEKDYLQHVVLSQLYSNITDELVFKGGTALQKAYALNRFSEDIDFDLNLDSDKNIGMAVERIERGLKGINNFFPSDYKKEVKIISMVYKLKIEGPFYLKPQSIQTIILEISTRETLLKKPDTLLITPLYKDISPYFVSLMSIDEMLSEKVRAIFTRKKARDLYDLYFLLHKGATINIGYINRKLEYYGLKFSKKELENNIRLIEKRWDVELSILMNTVPSFKITKNYVLDKF